MNTTITPVSCKYGAPMGRRTDRNNGTEGVVKTYLKRVRIDSGGYDSGGAYWGLGQPLFEAFNDEGFCEYLRARSREEAKGKLLADHPDMRFFR